MLQYLKTPKGPGWAPARDRKIYILWIALIWAGMIAGFPADMARYLGESPPPPFILHFHGAIYFLWLVLVTAQIALIETGKPALHRKLGWAVVIVSAAIVPLGLVAAMVDQARQIGHKDYAPEFLGLEFQSMVVFPAFLATGTLLRRDLAAHKRLMILAAITILDPGTARAFSMFSPWKPGGAFGWWLSYFWADALMVAAMIGWDLWKRRKIHPALIVGAVAIAAGEAVAVWLQFAPWWHDAMVKLVDAWGWAG
jgi:FtsH-binding integral membrane protein